MQEFFGKYTYTDQNPLGFSGLRLKDLIVNFTSPVIEVPQIKASALGSAGPGGSSTTSTTSTGDTTASGTANTASTSPSVGGNPSNGGGGGDLNQPNSEPFN